MGKTAVQEKLLKTVIRITATAFALFHLYTAFFGSFISIKQRSIHVGAGLALYFLIQMDKHKGQKAEKIVDAVLALASVICSGYVAVRYLSILKPRYDPGTPELVLAMVMIAVIFEATRRMIGWAIPLLALLSFLYAIGGQYFPGIWRHNGIKVDYVLQVLFYSDRGIWGSVTGISATIIAVFVIFGGILFSTGGGQTFMDLAGSLTGNSYGGAAKLATVASGLFGTISGSAGANVATTGAFTIPLMKRLGYSPEFAAGVESAASSGGQIMPPIMGAGAFIMAELLGLSYMEVAAAALMPSLLFYGGVLFSIDCKARREHLRGLEKDQIPSLKATLHYTKSLPIFVPIFVLLFFFLKGYTATASAMYAIIAAVVLYLLTGLKELPERAAKLLSALENGSKDMLTVISLIACAQILLCMISLTGVGVKFTNLIVALGGQNMVFAGICAMIATMIIGMGLPTVAAYMLAASVLAPALVRIGVAPIAAHFFVFYYAIFAGLTPPVCGTVFIGSAIAGSDWVKTAFISMRLSVGAFVIPFMFLFSPALLLQGDSGEIAWELACSAVGIAALASGFMGYLFLPLNLPVRGILCLTGILLVAPETGTSVAGLVIFTVTAVCLIHRRRKLDVAEKKGSRG